MVANRMLAETNPADLTPAIEVKDLRKSFGSLEALRGVSFTVPTHGVFCILGPNGAGKTTLIRILTTITRPDSGGVKIFGENIQTHALEIRNRIGIVAQDNHFDNYLSVWDNLMLHAKLHGLSAMAAKTRITELLESVGLQGRSQSVPNTLSGGMQRRVALIRALIHQPDLLFLDEPTTGLDPQARREIWDTVVSIKHKTTVILTTHYMEEADFLSDAILMMREGQVILSGTSRELKNRLALVNESSGHTLNAYEVILTEPEAQRYMEALQISCRKGSATEGANCDWLQDIHVSDPFRLSLRVRDPQGLAQLYQCIPVGLIQSIGKLQLDLEDVYLAVANNQLSGDALNRTSS